MPVEGSELDPLNGEDLVTTIDLNIQNIAEHERLEAIPVKKYFPRRVYGIVRLKDRALSPQSWSFIELFRKTASRSARHG